MVTNWDEVYKRIDQLNTILIDTALDHQKRQEFQKEHSYLSQLMQKNKQIEVLEREIADLNEQKIDSSDTQMNALYDQELELLQEQLTGFQHDLNEILFPPDPLNDRSVFLEIRAGTGGQEAALFAGDLLKMYTNYALAKRWQVSVVDISTTDLGGMREAIIHIEGKKVYGHLKHESGVHRVQRVPRTETSGRIHTSTATVAVLPEAQEVECSINPSDLRIDTYRASGAGGQHVNKTDSAVRITHIPSGVVVACQDERSQHKNRAKAMKVLQSRLLADQKEKQESEQSLKRKELVGAGSRAEKVRTYNFPQNRITDHQVELTLNKLDIIMEGDLEEIIKALMQKEQEVRRNNPVFSKK